MLFFFCQPGLKRSGFSIYEPLVLIKLYPNKSTRRICICWVDSSGLNVLTGYSTIAIPDAHFRCVRQKLAQHRPQLFLSRNLPALRDGTGGAEGWLRLRAVLGAGALHPSAVLRTLRPAL